MSSAAVFLFGQVAHAQSAPPAAPSSAAPPAAYAPPAYAPPAPPPTTYAPPAPAAAPGQAPQPVQPAAVAASEDTDAPERNAKKDELPFYRPNASELGMAPPPPGIPWMVDLVEDTHAFVVGSIRGWADETRVRFGKDWGFTLGTINFNTFGVGMDFLRFQGIPIVQGTTDTALRVYVLLPNVDVRGYVGSNRLGIAAGTSLTGLRVANCAVTGCFEASLRILTVDAWVAGDTRSASPAISVGGGLAAGIKL